MIKRLFDIIVASLLVILLFPICLFLIWQIRRKLGRPVLFRQLRPGLNGAPFLLLKFRSMANAFDSSGNLLPDVDRMTSFGRFMRAFSLDELPELWNVLKGEMSLVGPRPLLMEYLPYYNERQASRHKVRPGITGWAQVNGRNSISWEEKFELDAWYVENRSLWLDIEILCLTLKKVIVREGIYPKGCEIMPRFDEEIENK